MRDEARRIQEGMAYLDRFQRWVSVPSNMPQASLDAVLDALGLRRGPLGRGTLIQPDGRAVYVGATEAHAWFWLHDQGRLSEGLALVAARESIVGDEGPAWGGAA